jgi:hypothetical protein
MLDRGLRSNRKLFFWSFSIHPWWCAGGCWFTLAQCICEYNWLRHGRRSHGVTTLLPLSPASKSLSKSFTTKTSKESTWFKKHKSTKQNSHDEFKKAPSKKGKMKGLSPNPTWFKEGPSKKGKMKGLSPNPTWFNEGPSKKGKMKGLSPNPTWFNKPKRNKKEKKKRYQTKTTWFKKPPHKLSKEHTIQEAPKSTKLGTYYYLLDTY